MKLIGGRLCLDFINTVDGRKSDSSQSRSSDSAMGDKLLEYSDLVAWSRHSGILTATEADRLLQVSKRQAREAKDVFDRAIALRESLYRICKSTMMGRRPHAVDLETLNGELRRARSHERLTHEAKEFRWKLVDREAALDPMLWSIAQSAAELLTTGDLSRLRECSSEECGWLFEDTSRNRSRQWCDMQNCGNRAKVRRYRKRVRGGVKTKRQSRR